MTGWRQITPVAMAAFAGMTLGLSGLPAEAAPKHSRTVTSTPCADRSETIDKPEVSALVMISEGPLPDGRALEGASSVEGRCVESLRHIGRQAIEKKRLEEGTFQFLVAVHMAPALAGATY